MLKGFFLTIRSLKYDQVWLCDMEHIFNNRYNAWKLWLVTSWFEGRLLFYLYVSDLLDFPCMHCWGYQRAFLGTLRGHRNEILPHLMDFAVKSRGGRYLALEYFEFGTKISINKIRVVCVLCKNNETKKIRFYPLCVHNRRTE